MKKLRIVVGGFIGLYPTGGVTWDYIQYPLGLKMLGHDVYYIEDTGQYSNYRITERAWDDPHDTVEYLQTTMEKFGLRDHWAYRDTFSSKCYGMSLQKVQEICATADVFINISDSSILRDEYMRIPKRILIDSDPMFTQLQTFEQRQVDVRYPTEKILLKDYTHHFSFGENIGADDCAIPLLGINWLPTRQPICLDYWQHENKKMNGYSHAFTTVMNWSTRSKMKYDNKEWGQKNVEFEKFISIPKLFSQSSFEVVLSVSADFKKQLDNHIITENGWRVLNAAQTIATAEDYKSFITSSFGEFSVAKETYIKSNSGWFSCRSACYLAAGKPVITQETGWSKFIPQGAGLFAFHNQETAIEALAEVAANLDKHSIAAKEIATEYFDSNTVLSNLLGQIV